MMMKRNLKEFEEVTDDDEKKPVASGQSTEDTHKRIVKTAGEGAEQCTTL